MSCTNHAQEMPISPERYRWAPWLIVLVAAALLFLPWGGMRDLWFPDEPDVADPALTMLSTGNWIVPTMNAEPWLDYPPLTYWLGAISSTIFGASPWALRLPIALMAMLVTAGSAFVASRLYGQTAGLWCGLMLLTAPHFVFQAINYHVDMAFVLSQGIGIGLYVWAFLAFEGWRSFLLRALSFCFLGAAILSKGPLGLLLPGFILTLWHLSNKQWRPTLLLAAWTPMALLVALPWYYSVAQATGGGFVWEEIYEQNFKRFSAGNRGHAQPWHYYLTHIWANIGPWSVLIPGALWAAWQNRSDSTTRLLFIWFTASFLFLSAATTKREVYLLSSYPALFLLMASYLSSQLSALSGSANSTPSSKWLNIGFRSFAALLGAVAMALGLGLIVFINTEFEKETMIRAGGVVKDSILPLSLVACVLALGAWKMWDFSRERLTEKTLVACFLSLFIVYSLIQAGLAPRINQERSYRVAAEWLRSEAGARKIGYYRPGFGQKVSGFRVCDPAFMPLVALDNAEEISSYLRSSLNLVVIRADAEAQLASSIATWESLPKRSFLLSSKRYIALGPVPATALLASAQPQESKTP